MENYDFEIEVQTSYLNSELTTDDRKYLFSYNITIKNNSDEWAKLISRHWIIIDADGNSEEVRGEGVIGYQPEFPANSSFTYTSYCPLQTPWGTMEGEFTMQRKDNSFFNIKIKRFFLISDEAGKID